MREYLRKISGEKIKQGTVYLREGGDPC